MTEITQTKPILVTGGSGYIASWVVRYLLEDGHTVRATVRDKSNTEKISHLLKLGEDNPSGTLDLYEADLLSDGSFDEAMTGCELVIHTASPFFMDNVKDAEEQLVKPAKEGTRNVLDAATRMGTVKRVVLTSSVAAVYGDAADINGVEGDAFTEEHWNESSSPSHNPYFYSKVQAEREAWRLAKAQDKWNLVVINPGFVHGPSLSARDDSTSVNFMKQIVDGQSAAGVPHMVFSIVDVRDVARAHILSGFTPTASGRHILSAEMMSMLQIADVLHEKYGDRFKIPRRELPKLMLYLFGPFMGFGWKFIRGNIGIDFKMDNSYSKKDLGLEYRPVKETVLDSIERLIELGKI